MVDQRQSALHDLAGLPALRRRKGRDAHLRAPSPPIWSAASKVISIRTSIVRPASMSTPRSRFGERQQGHRPRHQGTRADRRLSRRGIRVMEMAAEIGRQTDLPLYVHFGARWSLPDSGANGEDADTIPERVILLLKPGDVLVHSSHSATPAASPNWKGEVHRGHPRGARKGSGRSMSATAAISPIGWPARRSTPG